MSGDSPEREYVEGLEGFLDASDEDRIDVDGICDQLPRYAPALAARWARGGAGRALDVGSGNGAKARYLVERLGKGGVSLVVDAVEPKATQRRHLQHTFRDAPEHLGRVHGVQLGEVEREGVYDLVLVIHSLYEFPRRPDGTLASLERIADFLAPDGAGVIVLEHPDGDFQRMKRELYGALGKAPAVSQALVVETLRGAAIPCAVGERVDFELPVGDLLDRPDADVGRHFAFLFSCSLEGTPLRDEQYATVGRWVRDNARRDGARRTLWTPDVIVWAGAAGASAP